MKPVYKKECNIGPAKFKASCAGYFSRQGQRHFISGLVTRNSVPVCGATVFVYSRLSGSLIATQISNSLGEYKTNALFGEDRFFVVAIDPDGLLNSVTADKIKPELMP